MIAYKFLRPDGSSVFTGFRWDLPDRGEPGTWVDAQADPCRSGIHACRSADLPMWVSQVMYEIELAGDIAELPAKVVASRGRLLRRVSAWDDLRDVYTRMCADRAHELALGATPPMENWNAVVEPSIPEGPALLGFVAARIAEERRGPAAYYDERSRQCAWLVEHLDLTT
jgi:hypothetical protein